MQHHKSLLIAACYLCGCSTLFLQTDGFPDKLKTGCSSQDSCEKLEIEAKARIEKCRDNTVGYIKCSDARADLLVASSYANKFRKIQFELEQNKIAEQRLKKIQDRQSEIKRLAEEQARINEASRLSLERSREESRTVQFELQRQQLEDNKLKEEQKIAAENAKREVDFYYLRLLGVVGREQRVRNCVKMHGPGNCVFLVKQINEAIGDQKEFSKLAIINETPIKK